MTSHPNLRPDAFAGAAAAYAAYRPPYPRALLADLLERAAVGPDGSLLDLACGPGRVALDLAASFETVWAVDLEPEMIQVGRQEAARRGAAGIRWFTGGAEDLDAPQGAFDLITIGEAFHRLDQVRIAEKALGWLRPGGCLATLGGEGVFAGGEAWQVALAEVRGRHMARAFPGGWALARPGALLGPANHERLLRAAGFTGVASRSFEESRSWTFEEIIGYLQSTSVCSRRALGDAFEAFEADLRAALVGPRESPVFRETLTWGYTLARKPR